MVRAYRIGKQWVRYLSSCCVDIEEQLDWQVDNQPDRETG